MATALDLLMDTKEDVNLLSEESDICTIDAKTRAIFVPSTIVVGGVQSDKNAERIKFSCPKIVGDNLDLSKFSVRINFENVSSVDFNVSIKDQYICDDVAVDGENVTFSWLIGRNAARYMGTVRFIVCAVKTDSDSNISVEWNTAIAEVPVLEGIEIDQPQIGQEEKDVINQLLELTKNTSAEAVQNVNSAKEQAIKDIQSVSQPDTTLTIEGGLAEAKATGKAIGSLKEDLDVISYFSPNVHDYQTDVVGFLNYGTVSANIGFRTTDYIDAKKGNTFYFYKNDKPIQCRFIEEYYLGNDGQKHFLTGFSAQNVYSYTPQSSDCKYIRVSFELSDSNLIMISTKQLDIYYPYGRIINNDKIIGLIEKQRQKIIINYTEDIHDYYNKMLQAFEQGDCDVYISKGDYVYTSAFMQEIRSRDKYSRGVPIGNGCRYYFESGAKIIAKYTGEHDSVYNIRGLFSPLDSTNQAGSYEIYGANIEAENTVYVIHDECASGVTPYKHIYKDCILSYKVDSQGESLGKCIGGGSGQYGTINIENCSFNTVNPNTESCPDVSYHGSKDKTKNNLDIFINNCYFSHHFEGHGGNGEGTMNLYFSSNSVDSLDMLTETQDHWNVKQWSNELRTS